MLFAVRVMVFYSYGVVCELGSSIEIYVCGDNNFVASGIWEIISIGTEDCQQSSLEDVHVRG